MGNVELGYYDSLDDRQGDAPFSPNSVARLLLGYEKELVRDFTIGLQYHLEHMMDFSEHLDSLDRAGIGTGAAQNQDRHTFTLRLTRHLFQQKFTLGCFTRFSPSDADAYIRPLVSYLLNDHCKLFARGNFFVGEHNYTFLHQFHRNNNVYAGARFSF